VPGLELHFRSAGGELVPRTGGETVVASIDAIADQWPEIMVDRSPVLDREVGDAAACIESIGRRKGVGRTGVEAGSAGAAMLDFGVVKGEAGGGQQAAEKEPGAMRAADEVGVLALPAEPSRCRQRLFHHRGGVHEHLDVYACARGKSRGDLLETPLDQVVIV